MMISEKLIIRSKNSLFEDSSQVFLAPIRFLGYSGAWTFLVMTTLKSIHSIVSGKIQFPEPDNSSFPSRNPRNYSARLINK